MKVIQKVPFFDQILTRIVKCELPDLAITYSTTVSVESVPNNYV